MLSRAMGAGLTPILGGSVSVEGASETTPAPGTRHNVPTGCCSVRLANFDEMASYTVMLLQGESD